MNKESLSNKFFNTFVVYSISDFVTKIVALVVVPLYAMFLTPKVFGLLELISVSISLITVVGLVGFSNALNRFFWEKDESLKSQEDMFSTLHRAAEILKENMDDESATPSVPSDVAD